MKKKPHAKHKPAHHAPAHAQDEKIAPDFSRDLDQKLREVCAGYPKKKFTGDEQKIAFIQMIEPKWTPLSL